MPAYCNDGVKRGAWLAYRRPSSIPNYRRTNLLYTAAAVAVAIEWASGAASHDSSAVPCFAAWEASPSPAAVGSRRPRPCTNLLSSITTEQMWGWRARAVHHQSIRPARALIRWNWNGSHRSPWNASAWMCVFKFDLGSSRAMLWDLSKSW